MPPVFCFSVSGAFVLLSILDVVSSGKVCVSSVVSSPGVVSLSVSRVDCDALSVSDSFSKALFPQQADVNSSNAKSKTDAIGFFICIFLS